MFHVIMLNGPPQVGKDTVAAYMLSLSENSRHLKYIKAVRYAVAELFNYPYEVLETGKDDPKYKKLGRTIRQHIIELGTDLRARHGQDIFGKLLADRILSLPGQTRYVVVSDLGFSAELKPVIDAIGAKRVTVVRIHQEGRTFEGDCREYLADSDTFGAKVYDIKNPKGDREYFKLLARAIVEKVTS